MIFCLGCVFFTALTAPIINSDCGPGVLGTSLEQMLRLRCVLVSGFKRSDYDSGSKIVASENQLMVFYHKLKDKNIG